MYCFPGLCATGALDQWRMLEGLPTTVEKVVLVLGCNDLSNLTSTEDILRSMRNLVDQIYCEYRKHIFWVIPPPRYCNWTEDFWEATDVSRIQEVLDLTTAAAAAEISSAWGEERHATILNFSTDLDPTTNPHYFRRQVVPRDEVHLSREGLYILWDLVLREISAMRRVYQIDQPAESIWLVTQPVPQQRRRYHLVNGREVGNKRARTDNN